MSKAILAVPVVFWTVSALAANMQDLTDCDDSLDIPRLLAACSSVSQDARLPPDVRYVAWLKRGFGHFSLEQFDAAEADFSAAIRLNPKGVYAHHELGLTLAKKGDLGRAEASLTEAIRLDPSSAASLYSRGQVYLTSDRLDKAIQDFTGAIRLGADRNTVLAKDQAVDRPEADRVAADYYTARADAHYLRGDFKEASSDYDRAARLSDPEGHALIWASIARARGRSADSDIMLSAALDKGQLKDWTRSIGELVAGRITAAAALLAARNDGQICEAHYYAGIAQLKRNDPVAARQEFTAAHDGCPTSSREYYAARADMKR